MCPAVYVGGDYSLPKKTYGLLNRRSARPEGLQQIVNSSRGLFPQRPGRLNTHIAVAFRGRRPDYQDTTKKLTALSPWASTRVRRNWP